MGQLADEIRSTRRRTRLEEVLTTLSESDRADLIGVLDDVNVSPTAIVRALARRDVTITADLVRHYRDKHNVTR